MTQEDKKLLLKDLSARLPYEVKCQWDAYYEGTLIDVCKCKTKDGFVYWDCYFEECGDDVPIEIVRPYLRPMSSMTEEEKQMMDNLWKDNNKLVFADPNEIRRYKFYDISVVDFLNSHHFDYRGLIEKGLALEAPKGMYK
jgi:hypothetical protein